VRTWKTCVGFPRPLAPPTWSIDAARFCALTMCPNFGHIVRVCLCMTVLANHREQVSSQATSPCCKFAAMKPWSAESAVSRLRQDSAGGKIVLHRLLFRYDRGVEWHPCFDSGTTYRMVRQRSRQWWSICETNWLNGWIDIRFYVFRLFLRFKYSVMHKVQHKTSCTM